jgi:hypothetical protein
MRVKIKLKLESEIDLIPFTRRNKRRKYFELKILFIRVIIEGIF